MTAAIEESIGDRLRHWATATPDKRFVQCGGPWRSYAEVLAASEGVAGGLQALGVARGQQVVTLLPNSMEHVHLFFACALLGPVQVSLNPLLRGEFLHYQLADSGAETLVTDVQGLRQVRSLADRLPDLRRAVVVGELPAEEAADFPVEVLGFDRLDTGVRPELPVLGPADLCSVIYTSGTTGMPKGCMMSHGYMLRAARQLAEADLMRTDDVLLTPYQLCHTSGQVMGTLTPLDAGASVALEPEYHVSTMLDRAREVGATVLYTPTAIFAALAKQPARPDDGDNQLRLMFPVHVPIEVQAQLAERFGVLVHGENSGQSEAMSTSITPLSELGRPETSGRVATEDFEVRTVDDDDLDVPVGEVGEIVVRARRPNGMFHGYWRKPADTVHVWRNLWHHTGDNGRLDADGYLTFTDRKKDSMRRRGENVSSIELELAISLHPDILGVACHAVPSELAEDDIKACIVPAPGATLEPEELFAFFKRSLPYYAIPRYVELLDELPRNPMGKVQKHKLVERGRTAGTWDLDALGLVVARHERRAE